MDVHKPLSSFALPGNGAQTIRFRTVAGAAQAVEAARRLGLPVIPLGGGTNCVFLEPDVPAVFLQSRDTSLTIKRGQSKTLVTAGAGLPWDDLVRFAVQNGLTGLERLSGIPGTCGAAPVQNIGAYGTELATTLRSMDVLDLQTLRLRKLSRKACRFGYRKSIFNTTARGRFLICSITLAFGHGIGVKPPDYAGFEKHSSATVPLSTIRRAILRVRRAKLPDYRITPNCGSFFKNPIVDAATAAKTIKRNSSLPHWQEPNGTVKLSAAWLIDRAGLRNRHWGKIRISPQHALVLINEGDRNHKNLRRAIKKITGAVHKKFGVTLETEPNLLDDNFAALFWKRQKGPDA